PPLSSASAQAESNQASLRTPPKGLFRGLPFNILFDDQSGTMPQVLIPFANLQKLEEILFQKDRKNTNPAYSLQKIEANGEVEGQIARIRFELTLSTSNDPLVSVPIGLREGVGLRSSDQEPYHQLEYVGEGFCDLTVDPSSGNYLLLIQNPQQANSGKEEILNRQHQIAFTLSFPVENLGPEERRMKISAPQAVSSRLVLSVPIPEAVATDPQGVAILRSSKPLPDGGTQFEILGFPKLPDLSWHRQIQSLPPEKQAVALQVEDAGILVRMTSRETEFDATLPIRAVGGPLQSFRVRLPPQTRYRAELTESTEYQIREIAQPDSGTETPTLEVIATGPLKQDTILPVRIQAVRSFSAEEQSWSELGGFEVLEAERQYGHVEIRVSNDLKLSFGKQHGIREDESSLLDIPNRGETQVRYVYSTQPFSLEAMVTLPQTRISVKPEYQVLLEKGQILLRGKVQVGVSGSKTNQLKWNFSNWQLEEIGPSTLVDSYGVIMEEGGDNQKNGTMTIPLRSRLDGTMELSFAASRPMPPGIDNSATVDFSLPVPIEGRIEPATIAIIPADNLELSNTNQEIIGMSRGNRNTPLKIPLPNRQQPPLIFRSNIPGDLSAPTMSFRSNGIFHKQEVQAHSRTVVRILEPKDQVEQTIQYNARFEPLEQITLLIPRAIHENDSLKLTFDGKNISETGRFSFPDIVAGTNLVRRRITLPTPLIGNGTLLLQYSMSPTEIQREMTMRIPVPQILPADAEIVEQTVVVSAPGGVNIVLADGNVSSGFGKVVPSNISLNADEMSPVEIGNQDNPWRKLEKNGRDSGFQETIFSTISWESTLSLSVQLEHKDILGTTVVERAWIQTWLADRIRVEQASFRIQNDREKIALFLPTGFDRTRVYVTWDNTQVPFQYEEGAIVIMQPKEQRSQSHLLVVKYQMTNEAFSSSVRVKIDLPYFDSDVWVRRTYWQVILSPQSRHLFGDLPGWTPEFHWNWTGLYWKRISSLSQDELELWIGASEKQDWSDSPEITHYLFSSFNPQRRSELFIIGREKLVLFSSGVILLVGFALIYFPRLRQLGVLFALAVLLVSIFLYQPTPALLVFQASILGVVLSLVSAILARILSRESDWKYIQPLASPSVLTPIKGTMVPSSISSEPQELLVESTHQIHGEA
ncbi:MAG: hypothetical protein FWC43_12150, partial [Planctomycetaceae bacterium]|nr:hypothetical protein [Planctomycetaceae bacterium]